VNILVSLDLTTNKESIYSTLRTYHSIREFHEYVSNMAKEAENG